MKPFSILLIKVLGLYLGLGTLFSVIPVLFNSNFHEVWSSEWLPILIVTVLVPIVGGAVLWFSAGALANRIHGGAESGVNINDADLVRAGTFLIGAYLLVQHTGILVNRYVSTSDIAYGSLLVVVLSLFMVVGTGFIGTLYKKAKYFGSNT
ncbi:hypothetical protein QE250_12805 [Chromatiaceae bacterium AAb-1]|nr:hypothetical protein [Chromatiaceae bacterium AAb-1]